MSNYSAKIAGKTWEEQVDLFWQWWLGQRAKWFLGWFVSWKHSEILCPRPWVLRPKRSQRDAPSLELFMVSLKGALSTWWSWSCPCPLQWGLMTFQCPFQPQPWLCVAQNDLCKPLKEFNKKFYFSVSSACTDEVGDRHKLLWPLTAPKQTEVMLEKAWWVDFFPPCIP